MMNLSSNTSSSCDVEFDRSALSSRVVEEGDVTEEDEDDGDGIRFAIIEPRF